MAEALDFGMIGVNSGLVSNAAAPFGGMKASGFGREGGFEGIEEYLETTYLNLAPVTRGALALLLVLSLAACGGESTPTRQLTQAAPGRRPK